MHLILTALALGFCIATGSAAAAPAISQAQIGLDRHSDAVELIGGKKAKKKHAKKARKFRQKARKAAKHRGRHRHHAHRQRRGEVHARVTVIYPGYVMLYRVPETAYGLERPAHPDPDLDFEEHYLERPAHPDPDLGLEEQYLEPSPGPGKAPSHAQGPVGCQEAAGIVADFGFSDVRPTSCHGGEYVFAATRDGYAYSIKIDPANGELVDVRKQG